MHSGNNRQMATWEIIKIAATSCTNLQREGLVTRGAAE